MYVCMYVCVCIYIYIYIHIFSLSRLADAVALHDAVLHLLGREALSVSLLFLFPNLLVYQLLVIYRLLVIYQLFISFSYD